MFFRFLSYNALNVTKIMVTTNEKDISEDKTFRLKNFETFKITFASSTSIGKLAAHFSSSMITVLTELYLLVGFSAQHLRISLCNVPILQFKLSNNTPKEYISL